MEFAMWAYPWDIVDEDSDEVTARFAELGVDEVNVAANYHTVQAFLPHNPERRTLFARASSYFKPGKRYGTLEPVPYEGMDGNWIADIARDLSELKLTAWTIGCHNSRLGMNHPEVTITSPYGDDLIFGLCPSHPTVQRYLVSLVNDLVSRGHFDRIEFETFDYFYGTGFGWHHQKIHTKLGALGEFLFGLCFCEHCQTGADNAGVAVEEAHETVVKTLDGILDGTINYDRSPEQWLRENNAVAEYAKSREDTLVALYEKLASVSNSVPIGYYVGMPEPGREWMAGVDLNRLAKHVDYYCLPAYESTRESVLDKYYTIRKQIPEIPLHVGVLPGHPVVHDEQTLVDIVTGLQAEGVPRVSFYNYGLLPERSLDWIATATNAVRTS